jgi:hypothetical protein
MPKESRIQLIDELANAQTRERFLRAKVDRLTNALAKMAESKVINKKWTQ